MGRCAACGRELSGEFAFCPFCGAPVASAAPREVRKVVTVLFCDVTGSTELGERLDPEALRTLLARYFERMKTIVERHGGTVEKFIGDAVMAVFGVPVVHEDDALRALRAAVEMRDALPELGVAGRLGVMTGEVVTGTEERLATGDAVNVAARLEQAAQPGEILIGDETFRLARDAVDVDPVEPLAAKGKSEPLVAHRLLTVHGDEGIARQLDTPLVGRANELRRLMNAYDQAVTDRSCQLFTILGPAGVGKSRLAAEFLTSLDGVRIVRGRCLPYGEGITYWPVVEVLKQLPAADVDDATRAGIAVVLGEDRITSKEEIARAFRKLLEAVAAEQPLVCVFDDVHWGEETFLDLVEHVADLSRDAPLLLLCIARPELHDARPGWGGGKVNATTVLLEPLSADDAAAMIGSLAILDGDVRARILDAAEGNPLFVEQMVALVGDSSDRSVTVPPTIQALLAARLEQLDEAERIVLERGAVEGRIFHEGAVAALAPEEQQVTMRLSSLVRKELVRPDKPQFAGEDAYRFRHVLIRDAAYDSLPKSTRAELHERFAGWLNGHGSDLVELEELLGYHLEQAYRCRLDLGLMDDETAAIGRQAAEWLASAGRRAYDRSDMPGAANLLERASGLLPENAVSRLELLVKLARAWAETAELARAETLFAEVVTRADELGDAALAAEAGVDLVTIRMHMSPDLEHRHAEEMLARAIPILKASGRDPGLARALDLYGSLPFWHGDTALAIDRGFDALEHARRAGLPAEEMAVVASILSAMVYGSTPVAEALAFSDELERLTSGSSRADVSLHVRRADLRIMLGELERARELAAEAARLAEELGLTVLRAITVSRTVALIELLNGDAAAAERELRPHCEALEHAGDWGHYGSLVPYLVDALLPSGRGHELADRVEMAATRVLADDYDAQIGLGRARARILAERGETEQALSLARAAVELADRTDYVELQAQARVDLAHILGSAGERTEAVRLLSEAIDRHERRGAVGSAAYVRGMLDG